MMEKPKYIIGIDPDVDKSGFAVLDVQSRHFTVVKAMRFVELAEVIVCAKHQPSQLNVDGKIETSDCVFVLEDSDGTTNWHLDAPRMSARKASAIGHGVGLCHATQRHIQEFAEYFGYKVEKIKPLKKSWMGRDGKITQEEIKQFIPDFPTSNQECRDAALLAWCYSNLPIRIPASFYNQHFSQEQIKKHALQEFQSKTKKLGELLLTAGLKKK